MSKGVHGIGAVVVESLRDVWGCSKVRINNGLDTSVHPFSSQTGAFYLQSSLNVDDDDFSDIAVVQRALSVAHGESSLSYTAYNVVSNNCEHFASWCRCVGHCIGQIFPFYLLTPLQIRVEHLVSGSQAGRAGAQAGHGGGGGPAAGACSGAR